MSERTVREVGEFGLIDALRDCLPREVIAAPELAIGIGDDAAIWRPSRGESLVITTDSLVEGVHFRLDWTDWERLGHKTLAVNVSDLAAMGAAPKLAVLTLGLRGTERVADLQALYTGIGRLAARLGMLIAGGDIVASPEALTIHVTAIGETRGGRFLTRAGARPGDLICVSGVLGASAAGYLLLRDDGPARRAATADLLIDAHLRPQPRVELGRLLLDAGASAAMDLSDGLFGDLPKILAASGVAAIIDETAVPIPAAVRALFPDRWFALAARGGEDYELLFTIAPDHFERLREDAAAIGSTVTAIGRIVNPNGAAPLRLRHLDGSMEPITAGAFAHFV